jgi:large subunit ribosomal protein L23
MATLEYYDILLKPVITEKSMELMAEKKYTFLVHPDANKYQIKAAIEEVFGVKVDSVHTMQYDGKVRRVGRTIGKTNRFKKAIVKLTADSKTIDFFDNIG